MSESRGNGCLTRVAPRRVFAYCHDSVGIGHLNRTLAICEALGRGLPHATFLLATGTPYVPLLESVPRVDYIKLPALAKVNNYAYRGKYLTISSKRLLHCREALLQNAVQYFAPDVVLVDKAPVGVCGELIPALRWLRENRPQTRVVFGMRDIEDEPEATIEQWTRAGVPGVLEECYDEIWVYGCRSVFDVATEYRLSDRIRQKLHFTGYVAREVCVHAPAVTASPGVLVTVGGGTDGGPVLEGYLQKAAALVSRMGLRSTLVGGPDLPVAIAGPLRDRAAAIPGVEWVDFDPCMNCRIRAARLVVSMGGYNTLCQIARNRKPALIWPRTKPRLEQAIRARLWSQRGALKALEPAKLSPESLAAGVLEMLDKGDNETSPRIDLLGLERVCARFGIAFSGRKEESRAAAVPM